MQQKGQNGRRRQHDPRQSDFLALLEGAIEIPTPQPEAKHEAGSLNLDQNTRRLLNEAIKAGPFSSRDDLAEAVSFHAGRKVTKAMIDSWTGASRPHALPAHMIPVFCRVLGNSILFAGLAGHVGCAVTESADLIRSRLSRLTLFIRLAKAEQKRLIAETPLFREARHA